MFTYPPPPRSGTHYRNNSLKCLCPLYVVSIDEKEALKAATKQDNQITTLQARFE
jgi:hypothetical protein